MTGNTFGRVFRITTSGESYSGAFRKREDISREFYGGLAVIVDGVPPGITLTSSFIQEELDKRKPGQSNLDTPRKENDRVNIFSGVMENDITTGAPVCLLIPNSEIDAENLEKHRNYKDIIRPGQAGYSYRVKYGEYADWAGAGRASGRETAARVAGGAVAKAVLDKAGIDVMAYTVESHGIKAGPFTWEQAKRNYRKNHINCPDPVIADKMIEDLLRVKSEGDTSGGIIEIVARGLPAGIGEPVFDKLSAVIAHGLMSIGAVKGIEFGAGFSLAGMKGSEANDTPFYNSKTGNIDFESNRAGGLLGGISNGCDIVVRVVVKPTPTISLKQKTLNMKTFESCEVTYGTKNDPSILTRIYPVCEAMVRIAILDSLYISEGYKGIIKMLNKK